MRAVVFGLGLGLLLVSLAVPTSAAAHPLVDEGKQLLRRAQFDEALERFAAAEEATDLTREDVIELLDAKALAHLALGDAAGLRADLAGLGVLDPDHRFAREAPPELAESFQQTLQALEGQLDVVAEVEPVPGGVEIAAEARNDAGLIRELRTYVRVDDGPWRRLTTQRQPVAAGRTVDYYVDAIGPGNAVLASLGSREAPETSAAALPVATSAPVRAEDDDGGPSPWLWVGIGGGALVIAGVILAVVLLSGDPSGTQPEAPLVIGF